MADFKRITPVQALFDPTGELVVIDADGVVWKTKNKFSDWERLCLLPFDYI